MTDQLDPEDDLSQGYGVTAKIREELNSPALQALKMAGGMTEEPERQAPAQEDGSKKRTPGNEKYYQEQIKLGRKPEEIEKEIETLGQATEPGIDPASDFIGGVFGAPLKFAGARLARLTPTLIRALGRGGSSMMAGYPIGVATEAVEEKFPALALPFSVIAGMVSGATIESYANQAILAAGKKAGVDLTEEAVQKIRTNVVSRLQDQAGGYKPKGVDKVEDEALAGVVKDLNEQLPKDIKVEKIAGANVIQLSSESKIDKGVKVVSLTRELDASNLFEKDLPFDKAVLNAKDYYQKTMLGSAVKSPAFDQESVSFTERGLSHVMAEHQVNPSQENIQRRLKLLPKVKQVLESTPFVDEIRRRDDGAMEYGLLGKFKDGSVVRVVVEEVRQDGKTFLSVYDWEDVSKKMKKASLPGLTSDDSGSGVGKAPSGINGRTLTSDSGNVKSDLRHLLGDPDKPLVEVSKEKVDSLIGKANAFLDQDVTDLPEKAININFARIVSGDDIKNVLARTADLFKDEIQNARRGVQSNEQTARLASLIGLSPEQLLARRRGQAFSAEEAVASRRILVSSGERLATLSKIISGRIPIAETEFADATLPELQAAFQKQILVHAGIQEQVSGMTAEAGRALQSFRIMAKSTEGKLKAVDELMKNINKSKMSTEDLAAMIAGIDTGEGLNTFVRQVRKATRWDMVMEAWINGLLSGPVTHTANMMSNGLVALLQVPERVMAAGISKLAGDQEIKLAEAGYQAFGLIEGFKGGLKAFGKAMLTGEASDQFAKIDLPMRRAISAKNFGMTEPGVAARAVDLLGEGVRIPGRLLTAEDEFFKSIGYRMELNARAYRQAAQEGLSGDAITRRVKEIVSDPPDDISSAAIDAARYQTFTKDLGETGALGQRFLAKAPALRLIVPFVQTPVNILKFAGERTPLAFASKAVREEIAAGGARRDMALARISMGSMIMATAAGAAGAGMITGGGPSDPELKAALRRTGWQPYSVKLGDQYYAFNRLEPLGMLLGIAADATEIISQADDNTAGEIASAAVIAISKNVTSKTWLKGVADAVEALDDPDRSAKKFLMNYVRTFVPTGLAQIEKEADPVVRETWDRSFFGEVANNIKARIPGWSSDLPPKRNLWGEAITWEGAFGPDILSPIYISGDKKSPIDNEMVRLKMEVAMPAKIQSFEREEIPLSPKEYDRYVQLMNTTPLPSTDMTLKKSLNALVTKDPDYRDATDERREVMIKRVIYQAKDVAKQRLMEDMPGLRMELDQVHHERMIRQTTGGRRRTAAPTM